MKKVLSLIIAAIMMISAFAVLPVSAKEVGAADEGNWETRLDATEEKIIENGGESTIPCPGYRYTEDGFEVIPPEYNNVQAKYTVISKTKYSTKDFSIKIRLDEYDASGDNWVSFTFWSERNGLAQGQNAAGEFGYGWTSLIRDADTEVDPNAEKDMKLSALQGFSSGNKTSPGGHQRINATEFEPIVDENGVQYLELKVVSMQMYINGATVSSDICKALRDSFKADGYLAYFGISVKSGLSDTPIKFTILEVDGVKPTGSDSKEPEVKTREFGEMIDSSTIPAGTPGVLFDATFENQNSKMPYTTNCTVDLTENNTFKVSIRGDRGSIGFTVRDEYSVDINDFPFVVIALKNFCTCTPLEGVSMQESCMFYETCGAFYCAGKTLAPDNDHRLTMPGYTFFDISPEGSEDYYTIFLAKATAEDLLEGPARIHSLRFDFAQGTVGQEFELLSIGYYRSYEDIVSCFTAQGYNISLESLGVEEDTGDEDVTDEVDPEEPTTEENYDVYPGMDEEDSEEVTTKKENKTTAASSDEDKRGCGSFVGMGAVAMIATASVAGVVIFKKRKED